MTREEAEELFGPIKTTFNNPPIPIRTLDWTAYFERYCDLDWPSWCHAEGPTEAEALETLLDFAQEHFEELMERWIDETIFEMIDRFVLSKAQRELDQKRIDQLDRLSGCNDL